MKTLVLILGQKPDLLLLPEKMLLPQYQNNLCCNPDVSILKKMFQSQVPESIPNFCPRIIPRFFIFVLESTLSNISAV